MGQSLARRLRLSDSETLSDVQLLALLIGRPSGGETAESLAHQMLAAAGSLSALRAARSETLGVAGVGPGLMARVLAGLELGRRSLSERPQLFIRNDADVVRWASGRLVGLEHEEVWLLCLNGRNGLKAAAKVAQGGIHGCALTPQDVLRPAVRNAATSVVIVHNHPSGDPTPSADDLQMTHTVGKACDLLGIVLLDHIVVAREGSASIGSLLGARL